MAGEGGGDVKFVADAALGRLARYLRMLGYDVVYVRERDGRAALGEAIREGRALLTRRRDFAGRSDVPVLVLTDDDVLRQLAAAVRHFGLRLTTETMNRCLECNARLRPAAKEEVWDRLPPHVRRTQSVFSTCPSCGRVYWPGTHYARALARLCAVVREAEV